MSEPESQFDTEKLRETTREMLEAFGEDPTREGLEETWKRRVPEMWEELLAGYNQDKKPDMTNFSEEHREMVVKTDIPFYSLCEHHLLPFHGKTHVAYIPNGQVLGLSKIIRYVKWRSRKLHTQERLTGEIAEGLMEEIDAKGVMVVIEAEHLCESMRGVEVSDTETITSAIRGRFENPSEGKNPREEFLSLINNE